jgi:ribosomal protein S14
MAEHWQEVKAIDWQGDTIAKRVRCAACGSYPVSACFLYMCREQGRELLRAAGLIETGAPLGLLESAAGNKTQQTWVSCCSLQVASRQQQEQQHQCRVNTAAVQ